MNEINIETLEPYVGPRPFDRTLEDQKRFFGRDYETDEIVYLVSTNKLTLIYGQTGVGKTSIFNAQVIPTLEKEYGFGVLPVTRVKPLTISSNLLYENMYKNNIQNVYIYTSLQIIKNSLDLCVIDKSLSDKNLSNKSLLQFLKEYCLIQKDENNNDKGLILIFDQLEELFELFPRNWKQQREDFFKQIALALEKIESLQIVFIVREEQIAQLNSYKDFLPQNLRPQFRLEQLHEDSAFLAVKGPLFKNVPKKYYQNIDAFDIDIKNNIKELMKIRIEYSLGKSIEVESEFIDPIELQVVFKRWWENIINSDNISNIQNTSNRSKINNSLEQFYEDVINEVITQTHISETKFRTWCEEKLITPYGTRNIIHRSQEFTEGINTNVIDILEKECFLQDELNRKTWYELSHDRLIQAIKLSNAKYMAKKREFTWLKWLKHLKIHINLPF